MAAAIAVAYYGRDNCSTSQSAAAASIANVIEAILFMAALGGGLYPVHRRSAKGVSTMVGAALGFCEGVAAARGNRKHDRNVMIFGISGQEETLHAGTTVRYGARTPGPGPEAGCQRRQRRGRRHESGHPPRPRRRLLLPRAPSSRPLPPSPGRRRGRLRRGRRKGGRAGGTAPPPPRIVIAIVRHDGSNSPIASSSGKDPP